MTLFLFMGCFDHAHWDTTSPSTQCGALPCKAGPSLTLEPLPAIEREERRNGHGHKQLLYNQPPTPRRERTGGGQPSQLVQERTSQLSDAYIYISTYRTSTCAHTSTSTGHTPWLTPQAPPMCLATPAPYRATSHAKPAADAVGADSFSFAPHTPALNKAIQNPIGPLPGSPLDGRPGHNQGEVRLPVRTGLHSPPHIFSGWVSEVFGHLGYVFRRHEVYPASVLRQHVDGPGPI